MPNKPRAEAPRAARLLLKAIRGLPEREQTVVLAYLVERAVEPSEAELRGPFGPSFVTPAFIAEVGGVAGRMLASGQPVARIGGLYGLPEEAICAALHEVACNPEAPEPLGSILGLLAEGRSKAAAARELGISADEATRALEGLLAGPPRARLGYALFAQARIRAQAVSAFAYSASRVHLGSAIARPEPSAPPGNPEGLVAQIGRLLLAGGSSIAHIAALYDVPEDAVRGALGEAASHADTPEPLGSVLKLTAAGRTHEEIAEELGIAREDVTGALEQLLPAPLERRLTHALQASVAVRSVKGPSAVTFGPPRAAGAGSGAQQMVPVRFPEPQYRRLKEWCGQHGFSMAVVVRGLVERFLDDQDRRAA